MLSASLNQTFPSFVPTEYFIRGKNCEILECLFSLYKKHFKSVDVWRSFDVLCFTEAGEQLRCREAVGTSAAACATPETSTTAAAAVVPAVSCSFPTAPRLAQFPGATGAGSRGREPVQQPVPAPTAPAPTAGTDDDGQSIRQDQSTDAWTHHRSAAHRDHPRQLQPPAAEPHSRTHSELTPGADPGAEPRADPGAEPRAEPGTEPRAEPGTGPRAEPGTEPRAEPGIEPRAEPGTDPGAEPESDPGADPHPPAKQPSSCVPEPSHHSGGHARRFVVSRGRRDAGHIQTDDRWSERERQRRP